MNWDAMAGVGRVARSHGNRGEVIVNPDTDFAEERFRAGAELFVRRDGAVVPLVVTRARFQQGRPIIGLRGVDSIDAADELAGLELRIPADRLVALPGGTFYRHDLVGCQVETVGGTVLGPVSEVEGTLHASRLVVETRHGDVLVPLATEICRSIDIAARRIVIDPPDGLIELNRKGDQDGK